MDLLWCFQSSQILVIDVDNLTITGRDDYEVAIRARAHLHARLVVHFRCLVGLPQHFCSLFLVWPVWRPPNDKGWLAWQRMQRVHLIILTEEGSWNVHVLRVWCEFEAEFLHNLLCRQVKDVRMVVLRRSYHSFAVHRQIYRLHRHGRAHEFYRLAFKALIVSRKLIEADHVVVATRCDALRVVGNGAAVQARLLC